jgi:hypothetical protein
VFWLNLPGKKKITIDKALNNRMATSQLNGM